MTSPESLSIASSGGSYAARLFRPQGERPAPGVLIVPEMYGLNEYIQSVARDYAAHGYIVLVMDVLWRTEPGLILEYTGPDNATAHKIHDDYDFAHGIRDMQAGIDHLRELPECNGKVGVVGFCLGGTMAFVAAIGTNADAAVDYYGSRAVEYFQDAPMITVPVLLHTGTNDTAFPEDGFERIERLTAANPKITSYLYDGARHAFANDIRADRYDPAATKAALERTFAFFDANLI